MAAELAAAGGTMKTERRLFLSGLAATLAGTKSLLAGAQTQQRHDPGRVPSVPDASGANGDDEITPPPGASPKEQLKENQKILRRDVDHLLQLAQDLKDESDKTPETDVLSLSLVKKTEDIERLARQIRDKIRAS
jgi:hypothetical protein